MRQKKRQAGFTLIEVLISLVLVVMIVQKAMATISNNQKNSVLSAERIQAYYLAMEAHDQLQSIYNIEQKDPAVDTTWDNLMAASGSTERKIKLSSNAGNQFEYTVLTDPDPTTLDNTTFQREIIIKKQSPDGTSAGHYRKVDINVTWTNEKFNTGDTKISMSYYFYDPNND